MARERQSLNRREALQRISVIGIGTFVSACSSSSSGNHEPTASPTGVGSPTVAPTALPSSTASRTALPTERLTPTRAAPTDTPTASEVASATPTRTPTPVPSAPSCILTPQQTLGPFFIDVGLARSDIREDRPGAILRLALQLVDAGACAPIRDAVVNVWHADAAGAYAGFAGQPGGIDTTGETFLRGFQVTDADGRVELTTIYPGWYTGRTVHIHVRIHLDSTTVLVSQLYFPQSITSAVHTRAPYSSRGQPDTTNDTDGIAQNGLNDLLLEIVPENGGYAGSIILGAAV